MPENWTAIAAEIAAAVAEVGFAAQIEQPGTQSGPEYDPTYGTATAHAVTVIDDTIKRRDGEGLETVAQRVLTVATGVMVPVKGWFAIVRSERLRILEVMPLAPGGVDLLYDLWVQK